MLPAKIFKEVCIDLSVLKEQLHYSTTVRLRIYVLTCIDGFTYWPAIGYLIFTASTNIYKSKTYL